MQAHGALASTIDSLTMLSTMASEGPIRAVGGVAGKTEKENRVIDLRRERGEQSERKLLDCSPSDRGQVFCGPRLARNTASLVNHFISKLAGPQLSDFAITHTSSVGFEPLTILVQVSCSAYPFVCHCWQCACWRSSPSLLSIPLTT
jgi:hypothetical protein